MVRQSQSEYQAQKSHGRMVRHKRDLKEERHKKKMSGPHGDILRAWEELRVLHGDSDLSTADGGAVKGKGAAGDFHELKYAAVERIFRICGEGTKMLEAAQRSDVSRVLQSCVKHGSAEQRSTVLNALLEDVVKSTTNSYAAPLYSSILRHSDAALKSVAILALIPIAGRLISHKVGLHVLDTAWQYTSVLIQRALVVGCLGKDVRDAAIEASTLSGDKLRAAMASRLRADGCKVDLEPSTAALQISCFAHQVPYLLRDTKVRRAVAKRLFATVNRVIVKGALSNELVVRIFDIFLRYGFLDDIRDVVGDAAPRIVHVMNTAYGSAAGINVATLASAPQRYAMVRSFRRSLVQILSSEGAAKLLMRLTDLMSMKKATYDDVMTLADDSGTAFRHALALEAYPRPSAPPVTSDGEDDVAAEDGGIEFFYEHLLLPEVLADVNTACDSLLLDPSGSRWLLHLLTPLPHRKTRYFYPILVDTLLWHAGRDDSLREPIAPATSWRRVEGLLTPEGLAEADVAPAFPSPWAKHMYLLDRILPILCDVIVAAVDEEEREEPTGRTISSIAKHFCAKRVLSELLWISKSPEVVPFPCLQSQRVRLALAKAMDVKVQRADLEELPNKTRRLIKSRIRRKEERAPAEGKKRSASVADKRSTVPTESESLESTGKKRRLSSASSKKGSRPDDSALPGKRSSSSSSKAGAEASHQSTMSVVSPAPSNASKPRKPSSSSRHR